MASKRRGRGEGGLEQLKSGSWRVEISLGLDGEGKRLRERRTFRTKSQALAWRSQRQAELGRAGGSRPGDAGSMTVGEWIARWQATTFPSLALSSRQRYEASMADVLRWLDGRPLATLTSRDVREWLHAMREAGRPDGMRRGALFLLRSALALAVEEERIPANPAADLGRRDRIARRKHREQCPLTPAECQTLVAYAGRRVIEWQAWMALGIDGGFRPSEMLALHWPEVIWEPAPVVKITRSLCLASCREKEPKTAAGRRDVPITAATAAVMRRHLAAQRRLGLYTADGLVFPRAAGRQRKYRTFASYFGRMAKAAGFPRLAPYDLRHTCATLLLSAGVSIRIVADRLGHTSPTITLRHYSHALPGQQAIAVAALEGILSPIPTTAPRNATNTQGEGQCE